MLGTTCITARPAHAGTDAPDRKIHADGDTIRSSRCWTGRTKDRACPAAATALGALISASPATHPVLSRAQAAEQKSVALGNRWSMLMELLNLPLKSGDGPALMSRSHAGAVSSPDRACCSNLAPPVVPSAACGDPLSWQGGPEAIAATRRDRGRPKPLFWRCIVSERACSRDCDGQAGCRRGDRHPVPHCRARLGSGLQKPQTLREKAHE